MTFLREGKNPSVALMSRTENIYGMAVGQFHRSDMLYISWFGWFGHPIFSLRDINVTLGLLPYGDTYYDQLCSIHYVYFVYSC